MGKVGGNAQPKKSMNLKPTNKGTISLLNVKGRVAKYIIMATMKHYVRNIIAF